MRALWNAPGFTATATATMALAIGSVVAIYSLYARVALHPLAVERPESLVSLYAVNASANFVPPTLSWPRFEFIAGETTAFEYLGAYSADSVSLADPDGPAEQLSIWRVSDDFFRVWGGRAALGRLFLPEENLPNGPAVCVLTEEFWRSRFGGRNVIGERIELNGVPTEIVGILTPNLPVPWHGRQIFLPRIFEDSGFPAAGIHAGASFLHVVGRLRDGVGRDQLTAELEANSASYRESFGAHGDAANDVNVEPLVDAVVGERKSTFTALVGAALAVLAIACANVAALYLGWRAARQRETAIRAALGASRWRLVAEIFGEALTIAALAGVVGTIIAAAALFALSDLLAAHLPSGTAVRLDPSAAAVGIFSVVASMCVIGLGPILKLNALGNLTTAQRGSSTSIAGSRFRAGLVVAETALSVALLVVAILLLVSLARLLTTSPGFDGTQVAAGYVNLPSDRYDSDERNLAFHLAVIERLGTMPGVEGAAAVFGLPFHDENYAHTYLPAGEPVVPPSERMRAGLRIVSEDYFRLMGMRIVAGRSFNADDRGSAPRVCIINESLHRRLGAGAATLGRVLLRGRNADQGCEIVGVVADVKTNGLKESTPDEIFYSVRQLPRRDTFYVVRTTGDPDAAAGLLRSAVSEQDSRIPVSRFASMNARYARMLGAERVMGGIISALAVAAVALATLGLFAVLSHAVINRTAEIGIRMAMGSSRGAVVGLIVQQGLGLVVAGVVIGSAVAWGASQLLSAQLFGIESAGPVYLVVAAIFLIIGGLAALGPALRGASIDPVAALRR